MFKRTIHCLLSCYFHVAVTQWHYGGFLAVFVLLISVLHRSSLVLALGCVSMRNFSVVLLRVVFFNAFYDDFSSKENVFPEVQPFLSRYFFSSEREPSAYEQDFPLKCNKKEIR